MLLVTSRSSLAAGAGELRFVVASGDMFQHASIFVKRLSNITCAVCAARHAEAFGKVRPSTLNYGYHDFSKRVCATKVPKIQEEQLVEGVHRSSDLHGASKVLRSGEALRKGSPSLTA